MCVDRETQNLNHDRVEAAVDLVRGVCESKTRGLASHMPGRARVFRLSSHKADSVHPKAVRAKPTPTEKLLHAATAASVVTLVRGHASCPRQATLKRRGGITNRASRLKPYNSTCALLTTLTLH